MVIIIMIIISSCSCPTSPDEFQMCTNPEPLFDFYFQGFYHKRRQKRLRTQLATPSTNQSIETCNTSAAAILVVCENA